jgi:predicted permease
MIRRTVTLALRKIGRYPGLSGVTFLTLLTGIGVSATIFTVAWAILFRPFVFQNQDSLVMLWANDRTSGIERLELSYEEVAQLRKEAKTMGDVAAVSAAMFPIVAARRGGEPLSLKAKSIGEPFFRVLGIRPAAGRTFTAADHKAGAAPVLMLSYDAWQSRFGGDPKIVGDTVSGSGVVATVVGILPKHLNFPGDTEIIFPVEPFLEGDADRANRVLTAIAKRAPSATMQDVNAEVAVVGSHVVHSSPEARGVTLVAHPLVHEILGQTRQGVRMMFGMGVLVLVISLLNVAAIALAQGIGRFDELGIRASVGATRAATAAQLFVEALVVALAAAVAATALVWALLRLMIRLAPPTIPRISEVSLGPVTVLFIVIAAVAAAGVSAAMQLAAASESALLHSMRAAARSASGRTSKRFLETLAAGQVAVAIVTVVMATLMIQSFLRYSRIETGFAKENVVTFHLPRGYVMAPEPEKHHAFFATVLNRIRSLPTVEAAGSVLMRPLEMEQGWDFAHTVEGQDVTQHSRNALANLVSATPGYLEAMRVPLVAGRTFNESDRPGTIPVVVIGESMARRYWGSPARALGKRLKSGPPDSEKPWMTVAGVVRDVRSRSLTIEKLDIYIPHLQTRWSPNYFAVRTSGDPERLIPAIRSIVASLDKSIPVSAVVTTHDLVDTKLAEPRLSAAILTVFAVAATLLSLIGLYGVLSYNVRQRTGELGVRLALGATETRLAALIAKQAIAISVVGTLIGLLASVASERLWKGFVYGIEGVSTPTMAVVVIGTLVAALIASAVPAARAMRIDPVSALRLD